MKARVRERPGREPRPCPDCGCAATLQARIPITKVMQEVPKEHRKKRVDAVLCSECGRVLAFKLPEKLRTGQEVRKS